ncbi:SDR family oxidoreductase [Halomicrococcus gelatinilyticus]|uniref:SDR family oxidoreductase n=1 Tax=Halomicrococcus gelatinilyticus TaxID=1702103 RepID=UPI002E15C1A7
MAELLEDTVAVVTGAASGIGRAIALTFAEEGADVVVADLREEPREDGEPTHELVERETDREARFVECDVSNTDDLESAVAAADELGGVDVMVNNAGIFRSHEFLDVTEAQYDQLMDVNVKGSFFGAQAAAKRMVEDDGGVIINMSSVAGLSGSATFATYCASKGAVRLLTYALADELGPEGVRVNAIHPGLVETAMTTDDVPILGTETEEGYRQTIPSRRFADPEDVADAALYLASDMADYVNGESLVVDGGMTNT